MGGRRDARTLPPKEMRSTSTDMTEPPESPIPAADCTGAPVEVTWPRLPSLPLLPPPVSPTTPSFSLQDAPAAVGLLPHLRILEAFLAFAYKPSVLSGAAFWAFGPWEFPVITIRSGLRGKRKPTGQESTGSLRPVKSTILGVHCFE
jgi:hypothetical protein